MAKSSLSFLPKRKKETISFSFKESVCYNWTTFYFFYPVIWSDDIRILLKMKTPSLICLSLKKKKKKVLPCKIQERKKGNQWLNNTTTCWQRTVTAAGRTEGMLFSTTPRTAANVGKCFLDYPVTTEDLQTKQSQQDLLNMACLL